MAQRKPHKQNNEKNTVSKEYVWRQNVPASLPEQPQDFEPQRTQIPEVDYDAEAEYKKKLEARKRAEESRAQRQVSNSDDRRAEGRQNVSQERRSAQRPARLKTASSSTSARRSKEAGPAEQRMPQRSRTPERRTSGQRPAEAKTPQSRTSSRSSGTVSTRKPSGGTAYRKKQPQNKKRVFSKSFVRGFLICWGVFVVLIAVALIVLSSSLKRFEANLPENVMNQILEQIENADLSGLHLVLEDGRTLSDPSLVADEGTIASYLQKKNGEEALRYVKINSESNDTTNVYSIRSGDDRLLKVQLERDSENNQEAAWEETETQITAEDLAVKKLTAQIPSACSLSVNGKAIDKSYVSEAGSQIHILENLMNLGIIGAQPTVDTYTIEGIFDSPEVVMTNESGAQIPCSLIHDIYSAGFEADEDFAQEQTERVLSFFDPYARYFSGDAGAGVLSTIMLDGSPAYNSAAAADVSWMQAHDGITLSEESVKNIRRYSDDCYSCEIHFKEDINQGGQSVRTWDTNMTWILVNDGGYYIADLITKTGEDE